MSKTKDFSEVTEIAGDEVTEEQILRTYQRYHWAAQYCKGKDVLELACGTGQGLGLLANECRSLSAGDISDSIVEKAQAYYGDRVTIKKMDALQTPFEDESLDVVLLFEALYYISSAEKFIDECHRVLRPGGHILIVTANKDLYDFNPSPYTYEYYGVKELTELLEKKKFNGSFFGSTRIAQVSARQKILRPIKKVAVSLNLIPQSMAGKKLLKRLVFGSLKPMPVEFKTGQFEYEEPSTIEKGLENRDFKAIFCAAQKQ